LAAGRPPLCSRTPTPWRSPTTTLCGPRPLHPAETVIILISCVYEFCLNIMVVQLSAYKYFLLPFAFVPEKSWYQRRLRSWVRSAPMHPYGTSTGKSPPSPFIYPKDQWLLKKFFKLVKVVKSWRHTTNTSVLRMWCQSQSNSKPQFFL